MNFQDLIKLYNNNSLTEADIDRLEYEQAKEAWFGKNKVKVYKTEEELNARKSDKDYR